MTEKAQLRLYTIDALPEGAEAGDLVIVGAVRAADIIRDVREIWRNIIGGNMSRYTELLEETLSLARRKFEEELLRRGYSGAVGVRISHPSVTERSADVIIYGTGFRWAEIQSSLSNARTADNAS